MQSIRTIFRKLIESWWFPVFLAVGGIIYYVFCAFDAAHTKTSFLDEGMYLYKGLLFATGKYGLYQPYGPWASHMPLSYLIPGYIQKWFGAGLATGRYFMIFIAVLTLVGLWTIIGRWGGSWWAAAAIWAMALNPAEIKLYTLALPQGLVAAFLVWSLVLTVAIRRPLWQIVLGSVLAAAAALIRENLTFVLPIVSGYVFWQHGRKAGLVSLLSGAGVFVLGYALYWPGILTPWADWLPVALTPFLDTWRVPPAARGTLLQYYEAMTPFTIFLYFWLTIRQHFVALTSAVAVWMLWPHRPGKPLTGRMRAMIFLSMLMIMLWALHLAATYIGKVCISCILLYVGYFDFLGLILIPLAFRLLRKNVSKKRGTIILFLLAGMILSIGFVNYEDVNSAFANNLIALIRDTDFWGILRHFINVMPLMLSRWLIVTVAGIFFIFLCIVALMISSRYYPTRAAWKSGVPVLAVNGFIIIGLILSPTLILGKGNDFFDCSGSDVLASYQKAGNDLRKEIPSGSKVYWEGRIVAIFLYLPDVEIYPPQLNQVHNFYIGGDSNTLYRLGKWNDTLAKQWLSEADYVLFERGDVYDWEEHLVDNNNYIALDPTSKVEKCRWQSVIEVYQRVEP
jgi:hypothetical protein